MSKPRINPHMAMAIAMRIVARIFFLAAKVPQGPLLSDFYAHINPPPKSRGVSLSSLENMRKMRPHSRGTCPGDLAGDLGQGPRRKPAPSATGARAWSDLVHGSLLHNKIKTIVPHY